MTAFISTVALEDSRPFDNFEDAFTDFYNRVQKLIKAGVALSILETACWIQKDKIAIYISEIVELAHSKGLLSSEGELQDKPTSYSPVTEEEFEEARQALNWGESLSPEIPYSRELCCKKCDWSTYGSRPSWENFVCGFSTNCPPRPPASFTREVGAIIVECPKCFSKFWFHATELTLSHLRNNCPSWPKNK